MRYFKSFLATILLFATFIPSAQAQEKKLLTNAQILGKMPEGIVGQTAFPISFDGNKSLIYREGRDYFKYDLKKGTIEPYSFVQSQRA